MLRILSLCEQWWMSSIFIRERSQHYVTSSELTIRCNSNNVHINRYIREYILIHILMHRVIVPVQEPNCFCESHQKPANTNSVIQFWQFQFSPMGCNIRGKMTEKKLQKKVDKSILSHRSTFSRYYNRLIPLQYVIKRI